MFRKLLELNENINAWYDRIPEPRRMISMIVVMIILMTGSYFIFGRGDDLIAVGLICGVAGFSRLAYFHFNLKKRLLKKGPFKGMTLEMGSDTRLKIHGDFIPEFMHVILDIDSFLITDESSLDDFISMVADTKTAEMAEIWAKIDHVYGITYDKVGSNYIADILDAIPPHGKPH